MNSANSAIKDSVASRRRGSSRRRGALFLVLGAEIALIASLHAAGFLTGAVPLQGFGSWLVATEPGIVLPALVRLVGLAIGYWLLVSTVLYAGANLLGAAQLVDGLRWITLPVVRRAVQGVTAVSITGASLVGPATVVVSPALAQGAEIAQGEDDTNGEGQPDDDEADEPVDDDGESPMDAAGWPDVGEDGDFWRPAVVAQTTGGNGGPYTVVRHDHLWKIAETHLRTAVGREVTEDETCQYWLRVIDANRSLIRSGDPDLIYPSEQLTLPPVFSS